MSEDPRPAGEPAAEEGSSIPDRTAAQAEPTAQDAAVDAAPPARKATAARKTPAKKAPATSATTDSASAAVVPDDGTAATTTPAKKAAPAKKTAAAKKTAPAKKSVPAAETAAPRPAEKAPPATESTEADVPTGGGGPEITSQVATSADPAVGLPAGASTPLAAPPPGPPGMQPSVFYPPRGSQPISIFGNRWPGPGPAGGRAVPIAVLCGALAFAIFVPLNRVGIGWLLGGLGAAIGVTVVARLGTAQLSTTDRVFRAVWGVAALALLSVLAFRNAWWLVTFCVMGAIGCAALAVAGGRSIRAILFSQVALPLAALRSQLWVSRHLRSDRAADPDRARRIGRLVWSIIATAVLLLIFGALFASADAAFAEVLSNVVPRIDVPTVIVWVFLLGVGALVTMGAVYLVSAPPDLAGLHTSAKARLGRLEWALPIGALVALFLGFVAVQVTVLFGGRDHVLGSSGPTYAEYARSGFWQLTWATVLTLAVIAAAVRWAAREQPADRLLMRILLGALSALAIVIVASALSRMYTYQQAYSFTGERIFVMGFELLLGVVFLMIIIAGVVWDGSWIPRATVATMVLLLLGLAVMNPEAYAAKRNVDRYNTTGKIDLYYLAALRADATAELAKLPPDLRRCALSRIDDQLREPDPWYAWNLGRQRARKVLNDLGPGASGNCRNADRWDYSVGR